MNFYEFINNLFNIIKNGHIWQYTTINGYTNKNKSFYTWYQWTFIILGFFLILIKPNIINKDTASFLIAILAILCALMIGSLTVVSDKLITFQGEYENDEQKTRTIKRLNLFKRLASFITYDFILSILVIVLLSICLFVSSKSAVLVSSYDEIDWALTFRTITHFIIRLSVIYFTFDIITMAIFSVTSVYNYFTIEVNDKMPDKSINPKSTTDSKEILEKNFPHWKIQCVILCIILILLLIYVFIP